MPHASHNTSKDDDYIRRRHAVADYMQQKFPNMRAAAAAYGLTLTTFARAREEFKSIGSTAESLRADCETLMRDNNMRQRPKQATLSVSSKPSTKRSVGRPTVLTSEEEDGVVELIIRHCHAHMSMTRPQVGHYIMRILSNKPRKFHGYEAWMTGGPTDRWWKGFCCSPSPIHDFKTYGVEAAQHFVTLASVPGLYHN